MKLSPEARMVANARAWLAESGFPPLRVLDDPPPQPDHCYLEGARGVVDWADLKLSPWKFAIGWKDHQPLGYKTARGGWREPVWRWSAQLIYHQDPISSREFLELDFDSFNPDQGAAPAIGHVVWDWMRHKVTGSKTSPYTVAKKRGWAEET